MNRRHMNEKLSGLIYSSIKIDFNYMLVKLFFGIGFSSLAAIGKSKIDRMPIDSKPIKVWF